MNTVIDPRALPVTFLAFLMISAVIHLNGSPVSLLSDDFTILKAVDEGGPLGMWSDSSRAYFRPLVSMLYWTEYQVWHLEPMGYRVVSVLMHSLCSLLVAMIGLMVMESYGYGRRRATYLALLGGVLFLTSACHSEPVSWASCQADLLAGSFGLLALWSYIRGRTIGSTGHLVAAAPLFVCSLFSKESAVALPMMLLCYEVFGWRFKTSAWRTRIRDLAKVAPYFLIVVLYIAMRYFVIGSALSGYVRLAGLRAQVARVMIGLASYPTRTYLPPLPTRAVAVSVFGVLMLAVLAAMYIRWKRGQRPLPWTIPLLAALYLISLLPVINRSISKTITEGERLAYFPSVFGILLLVVVLDFIIDRLRTVVAVGACLAVVSGLLLIRAESNWKDAAEITHGIRNSLETMDGGGTLAIFNLPDNLKGAFVFRNGFRDMLSLIALDRKWEEVVILATFALTSPDDSVCIERRGNLICVTQSNPEAVFLKPDRRLQDRVDPRYCRTIECAADAYTVELNPMSSGHREGGLYLTYYARGRLVPAGVR